MFCLKYEIYFRKSIKNVTITHKSSTLWEISNNILISDSVAKVKSN